MKKTLMLYAILFSFLSCVKITITTEDDHKTEPERISAYINAYKFIPCNDKLLGLPETNNTFYVQDNELILEFNSTCEQLTQLSFKFMNIDHKGFYQLDSVNRAKVLCSYDDLNDIFTTTNQIGGVIYFPEFDTVNRKLSAFFEFEAINADSTIKISVTDGIIENTRFNLKY
ncbi:hypothetical protein [Saccharicrinis sp. FJH54]|uniref:hypothetical protein n=1 Tax=Saccharicrinis sp. FJH54 TaxID=3344665 RepID=UPI0035D422BC